MKIFGRKGGQDIIWIYSHNDATTKICDVLPDVLIHEQYSELDEDNFSRRCAKIAIMHGGNTGDALLEGRPIDSAWSSGTVFIVCSSVGLSGRPPRVVTNVNGDEVGVVLFIQQSVSADSFHKEDWKYIIRFILKNLPKMGDLVNNPELLKEEDPRAILTLADHSMEYVIAFYLLLVGFEKNIFNKEGAKELENKIGKEFWGNIQAALISQGENIGLPSNWKDFLSRLEFWVSKKNELNEFISRMNGFSNVDV